MAFENDDFEPTIKGAIKEAVKTKKAPRWRLRQARRLNHTEYVDFCKLTNETPEPAGGQISAAKLKGSPEYTEKVNKMAERRAHVRTHEPEVLATNIRWCGCCMDKSAPETMTSCCWCAEYGGPDMKPISQDKYVTSWTPAAKKRKIRPHDKPCKSFIQYNTIWPRANKPPIKKFGSRFDEYCAQDNVPYAYCYMNTSFYYA